LAVLVNDCDVEVHEIDGRAKGLLRGNSERCGEHKAGGQGNAHHGDLRGTMSNDQSSNAQCSKKFIFGHSALNIEH